MANAIDALFFCPHLLEKRRASIGRRSRGRELLAVILAAQAGGLGDPIMMVVHVSLMGAGDVDGEGDVVAVVTVLMGLGKTGGNPSGSACGSDQPSFN